MNEATDVANAGFSNALSDEIVRLNKVIKELEIVMANLYVRIEFLQSEITRLETTSSSKD